MQFKDAPQFFPFGEVLRDAAIIEFEELAQHQNGEQLRAGEIMPAELVRVARMR